MKGFLVFSQRRKDAKDSYRKGESADVCQDINEHDQETINQKSKITNPK